jgi:hypothetical protein
MLSLPSRGLAQQPLDCLSDPDANRIDLGTPAANGTTQAARLSSPTDSVGFRFLVPQTSVALLYVGDQWYDINLYLYARSRCPTGSWDEVIRAWSVRADQRVIQFMRPNEQIVNLLAGEYVMLALYKPTDDPARTDPFDPSRGFTGRVALSTPYCAVTPPDVPTPNPIKPNLLVKRRPDDALYQLGLSIDPAEKERGPFALLTFSAFVSPPYTDLFDFNWTLDDQPQPDATDATFQLPVSGLIHGIQHQIQVTAVGARQYPDPALTHIPPTLSVECPFRLAS